MKESQQEVAKSIKLLLQPALTMQETRMKQILILQLDQLEFYLVGFRYLVLSVTQMLSQDIEVVILMSWQLLLILKCSKSLNSMTSQCQGVTVSLTRCQTKTSIHVFGTVVTQIKKIKDRPKMFTNNVALQQKAS